MISRISYNAETKIPTQPSPPKKYEQLYEEINRLDDVVDALNDILDEIKNQGTTREGRDDCNVKSYSLSGLLNNVPLEVNAKLELIFGIIQSIRAELLT